MTTNNFTSAPLGTPASGLASRRGGQNIKPLSFDAIKSSGDKDNGAPTPRTSRSHLLAGLRTAPKTAVASSFPSQQISSQPQQQYARNVSGGHSAAQDAYNPPKTALPRFNNQQSYSHMSDMQQQQQQHFTAEQVLAPPEIQIDDHSSEQMDPNMYAQLVATNVYLAQQQQALQQQLRDVQAAAQQFQGLSIGRQQQQPQYNMYGQNMSPVGGQQQYYDQATGQTYVINQAAAEQFYDQAQHQYAALQQQQLQLQHQLQMQMQVQMQMQQLPQSRTPRVQVSPPPDNNMNSTPVRSNSPPKRYESPSEHAPLPPPSANAFRRGHKKASSLANATGLSVSIDVQKGPKSAAFPLTPLTGGYGPGQARAGEHPIRQPRGPPAFDELSGKPTAKHEGSKNFAARTRRSAVHNLVRAGKERRKGTGSSTGSMSPVSESAEESETPITDHDSESGRSGPGSLAGDMECSLPSSRTSTSGWGAIGSDRPSSRQKSRDSVDSATSASEMDGSFASLLKNRSPATARFGPSADSQRKSPMLVLTKNAPAVTAA